MPFQLDEYDVSILQALIKDGRKSFREISRETGITTPTVKTRFERLIDVGFIKSVSPIFDFGIVDEKITSQDLENKNRKHKGIEIEEIKQFSMQHMQQQLRDARFRIRKGMKIKFGCEFCRGPITGDPHVFRFANFERFFCCKVCMSDYKQKYAGRIESIKREYNGY
jgi:Lrp/AsnC family leucine-responsive transcriptional regulator